LTQVLVQPCITVLLYVGTCNNCNLAALCYMEVGKRYHEQ
jgi:hypothetical protein